MAARVTGFIGDWNALLILFLAGVLPNEIWRWLGVWLGSGLDEGSEFMVWVRAVATAVLAGVIAQLLVEPPGALASITAPVRYGSVVVGFAIFLLTRKSIFAGVVGGEIVLFAGQWWLQ